MKAENDTPSNAELLTEAVLDDTLNIDVYATDPEERGHHDRFMAAAEVGGQGYARSGKDPQTAILNLLVTVCNHLRRESS